MFLSTSQSPNFSYPICAHRSTGFAVMFALGEVEALIAAFTCLLLLILFLGTLLQRKTKTGLMCQGFHSVSAQLNQYDCLKVCIACVAVIPINKTHKYTLSINSSTGKGVCQCQRCCVQQNNLYYLYISLHNICTQIVLN